MSMIHACIEDSQGLKDLYNQGFEKKHLFNGLKGKAQN
jgi:hypothetical protein